MDAPSAKPNLDNRARVMESVRSGLAAVGLDAGVVLKQLSSKYGFRLDQVPERPGLFADALYTAFGDGAKPIVLSILRELFVCSYEGVEFSPLAVALTETLGPQDARSVSPRRLAAEREQTDRKAAEVEASEAPTQGEKAGGRAHGSASRA